ncbi:MAG: GIY-YIG nuclease family protein [Chloroflexota bacterium]
MGVPSKLVRCLLSTKGSYLLLIRLAEAQKIRVGALGTIEFRAGFYAYVGSAMGGFGSRLRRHLRKDKKAHWHIDYLLEQASVEYVIISASNMRTECAIARTLSLGFASVAGFGSSDCRCRSHLFYASGEEDIKDGIIRTLSLFGYLVRLLRAADVQDP